MDVDDAFILCFVPLSNHKDVNYNNPGGKLENPSSIHLSQSPCFDLSSNSDIAFTSSTTSLNLHDDLSALSLEDANKNKKSEENLNAGPRIYLKSYSAKQKRLERKTSEIKDMLLNFSCNEKYSILRKTINTTIDDAQQETYFSTCESILEGKLCAGILNLLKLKQKKKLHYFSVQ